MITTVIIIMVCDLGCAFASDVLLHGRMSLLFQRESFSWYFYNDTGDCVLMSIARCVLLPMIAYLAIRGGDIASHETSSSSAICRSCNCFKCFYGGTYSKLSTLDPDVARNTFDSQGDMGQPLLRR